MKKNISYGALIIIALVFASCHPDFPNHGNCDSNNPVVRVYASGLNNPRGLKFGPDHNLYVAEGGTGGTNSTVGTCEQVPAPIGPYTGGETGARISLIDFWGTRHTVTDNLPSSVSAGGDVIGVADVAFRNNSLYALLAGAGCSHGVPSIPNGLVRLQSNGSWNVVADISSWLQAHPVANPEEDDFEPDGSLYSMTYVDGNFYALEANHGDFLKITPSGEISRVVDISASQGHIVPTAVTYNNGHFYIGNLHPFPIVDGSSNIYRVSSSGNIEVAYTGFTTILGLTHDRRGRLFVLENTTGNPYPTPGTGKVIRINEDGSYTTVISGLSLPTGIAFGPDEKLYISNIGLGPESLGGGQVLQVDLCSCSTDTTSTSSGGQTPGK